MTGASIGSYNAAFLTSKCSELQLNAVNELEEIWTKKIAQRSSQNGGYRIRFNPLEMMNPFNFMKTPMTTTRNIMRDSLYLSAMGIKRIANLATSERVMAERFLELFNASDFISISPWKNLIEESIDFEKIRKSPVQLYIVATDWGDGVPVVFTNKQFTKTSGPEILRASSAMPGIFPEASMGSRRYVDGCVVMNTPLKPAIRAGADEIHLIDMNASIKHTPLPDMPNTLETLYRQTSIEWLTELKADLQRVDNYNKFIAHVHNDEKAMEALAHMKMKGIPNSKFRSNGEPFRILTVHRYHPPEPLGGFLSILDLRPEFVESLIERGYYDTINHNCEENGCVLPP